jgi:hypothetical protein
LVEGSTLAWRRIRKLGVLIIVNPWIFSEWITVNMCVSCCSIWVSCRNWQSSLQGVDLVSHSRSTTLHLLIVVLVDAWDLCNISFMDIVVLLNISFMDAVNDSIMCIISLNCLSVTKSSSSSSRSYCGGCFLEGMVSGIEKCSSRWLGVSKEEPQVGGITHTLKLLTPLL